MLERGADVEAQNTNRVTPLHIASGQGYFPEKTPERQESQTATDKENNYIDIVRMLLTKSTSFGIKDYEGRTPLEWAAANGHPEIMKMLIEKAAPIDKKGKN